MAKAIEVVEKATGEVVETIDVTHESDRDVSVIRMALYTQMNREEYSLRTID